GLLGFALMLGFLYWRWLLVGRDPAAGPKFPRYEPPKGISAAAVRFIDRQGFDDRCFAAALLSLGSRGFVKIHKNGDGFELRHTALAMVALITLLIVASLFGFYRWLPAYSAQGRRLEDEIEGLRQYLGVAERDELSRTKAPPKTPEEFSKFLPYAVALDVEKTWADRFAIALGSAALAAAVSD